MDLLFLIQINISLTNLVFTFLQLRLKEILNFHTYDLRHLKKIILWEHKYDISIPINHQNQNMILKMKIIIINIQIKYGV